MLGKIYQAELLSLRAVLILSDKLKTAIKEKSFMAVLCVNDVVMLCVSVSTAASAAAAAGTAAGTA